MSFGLLQVIRCSRLALHISRHSYVTVAAKFRHKSRLLRAVKIITSRVKTAIGNNWKQLVLEFVMRRSGVRFISPAPI